MSPEELTETLRELDNYGVLANGWEEIFGCKSNEEVVNQVNNRTTSMIAVCSTQGVAMAETALCAHCAENDILRDRALSIADDADDCGELRFVECTENDALYCIVCRAWV